MKKTIVLLSVLALLVCCCACQKTPVTNDPTQATTIPAQTQPADTVPSEPLQLLETQPTVPNDPRIAEFQALFDWRGENRFYNAALLSVYESPADVNLETLFYCGFTDESQDPTEEEIALLNGKMGEYWQEMDLIRLPAGKMDTVLMELFGITLDQTNGADLDKLVYLGETDCYYTANTGTYYADITVAYVEDLVEGGVLVYYHAEFDGDYVVRLMPTEDGGYQIISNTKL